jgi:ribonuclease VapC
VIVDTSALIAVALGEPIRERVLEALETAADRVLSSMSLLEAGMVLRARLGENAAGLLYQLVDELVSEVAPFDEMQARLAIAAFGRFGKGMGHRAQLNLGDCAVYALAQSRGEPVLAAVGAHLSAWTGGFAKMGIQHQDGLFASAGRGVRDYTPQAGKHFGTKLFSSGFHPGCIGSLV